MLEPFWQWTQRVKVRSKEKPSFTFCISNHVCFSVFTVCRSSFAEAWGFQPELSQSQEAAWVGLAGRDGAKDVLAVVLAVIREMPRLSERDIVERNVAHVRRRVIADYDARRQPRRAVDKHVAQRDIVEGYAALRRAVAVDGEVERAFFVQSRFGFVLLLRPDPDRPPPYGRIEGGKSAREVSGEQKSGRR